MNTNNRFLITLPDRWSDRTVYLFQGPDDSGVQHNLQLVIEPETDAGDVAEYARTRIDNMMASLQGAEILKEEQKTLADGRAAYECVYKWIPVDGQINFNKVVYLMFDGVGYTFAANFSKKTIKTIGVEVDRIIESFRPGADNDDE
jgi:hypothetical protein